MKALLPCLAAACVLIWGFVYTQTHQHQTATLLPGQTLTVAGGSTLTIRAEYPVAIIGPGCRAFHTADATITCGPGPVEIIDTRPALLVWARSNRVDLRASRF